MAKEEEVKIRYCPQCGNKIEARKEGLRYIAWCKKCNIQWEISAYFIIEDKELAQAVMKFCHKYLDKRGF